MEVTEQRRHNLHTRLDEVLGSDDAVTLMAHLPPVGWADVARRSDLDHLGTTLRSEFRGDFHELRAEMHKEFGDVRAEMSAEAGSLRSEIGQFRSDMAANHRQLFFALVGSQFTAVSLVVAAIALMG